MKAFDFVKLKKKELKHQVANLKRYLIYKVCHLLPKSSPTKLLGVSTTKWTLCIRNIPDLTLSREAKVRVKDLVLKIMFLLRTLHLSDMFCIGILGQLE